VLLKNRQYIYFTLVIGLTIFSCSKPAYFKKELAVSFQEADLVFRRGSSLASQLVLKADQLGVYSHIGIVVWNDNRWMVVHAVPGEHAKGVPDRVKMECIPDFFADNKANSGAIMRMELSPQLKHLIAQKAMDVFHRNTLFDHDYNLKDTTEMYCTELVWFSYKTAGIDITNRQTTKIDIAPFQGDYILPSDIQTNKDLKLVYSFNN
jgi:hypothetical protein